MFRRVSTDRHFRRHNHADGATRRNLSAALTLLGMMVIVAGCQSPGTTSGLRLPGTPNLPSFPSAPTPNLTPGGNTPAMPGGAVSASISDDILPDSNRVAEANTPVGMVADSGEIAQVGFVQRRRSESNNRCNACQSGDACVECQSTLPFQPMLGRPIDPQEFLCNGGDAPQRARVLRDDSIAGLDPQDTVVHYTTEAGDIELLNSNQVCVYSPRFGSVRQVSGAVAGEKAIGLRGTYQPVGPTGVGYAQPSLTVEDIDELAHADVTKRIDAMRDRNRGVPVEGIVQPVLAEDALQILATLDFVSLSRLDESQIAVLRRGALAAQSWMIRDAVEVMIESMRPPVLIRDARAEAFVEYDFPDAGRLQIVKVADKDHAQQGEEITFAIRIRNVGDSAVRQVEIADSLVTRLEYIEDSQQCDREATFETRGNSAGSIKMMWSLTEPLAVGESAKIEFKCRVR